MYVGMLYVYIHEQMGAVFSSVVFEYYLFYILYGGDLRMKKNFLLDSARARDCQVKGMSLFCAWLLWPVCSIVGACLDSQQNYKSSSLILNLLLLLSSPEEC